VEQRDSFVDPPCSCRRRTEAIRTRSSKRGAIYSAGVLGLEGAPEELPLKQPAAAHAPNPAPVATKSAAPPITAPAGRNAAPQVPGEFAEVAPAAAVVNHQYWFRPSGGIVLLVAPGCSPAGALHVVL